MTPYLDAAGWVQRGESDQNIVTLGGGYSLLATLRALCHITHALTVVVAAVSDGGSSDRPCQKMPILPPGDLCMVLVSLCEKLEWGLTWYDVMWPRLDTTGPLNGHTLGNLLISGLWRLLEDPVEGLDWVGRLLGTQGCALLTSSMPASIEADMNDGSRHYVVSGQSKVVVAPGTVGYVYIISEAPEALSTITKAISKVDWVVLRPGSWYTPVIPYLLVPELNRAPAMADAHRTLVPNLVHQRGEVDFMSTADHVCILRKYAPMLKLDAIITGPMACDDINDLIVAAEELGMRVLLRQVHTGGGVLHYDPLRLATVSRNAFNGFLGEIGESETWLPQNPLPVDRRMIYLEKPCPWHLI